MKLSELLNIDKGRIERSSNLRVELVWTKMKLSPHKTLWSKLLGFIKRQPHVVTNLLRFKVTNPESKSEYTVFIELDPKDTKDKFLRSTVKLYCSCNDFKYRSAYILNKSGNLVRSPNLDERLTKSALEQPPRLMEPSKMCKHIYAIVGYIQKNWNKLNLEY